MNNMFRNKKAKLHTHPLGFGSFVNWSLRVSILQYNHLRFLISEIDLSKYFFFFVNFANKIYYMHCIWVYNNEFFYYKVVCTWQISTSKIDKKCT